MAFIVSQKSTDHGLLVVVTDQDLLGKAFKENKKVLDISKDFYKGEEMSLDEVKELFKHARHIHLTGKESVALGVELDYVDSMRILYVDGIPHAQVFVDR